MSQRLTREVAFSLRRGDVIYHNLLEFVGEDGEIILAKARVVGRASDHPYYSFRLPVKLLYGATQATVEITGVSTDDWRTVEEKVQVPHVRRVRVVTAVDSVEEASPPLPRVRRSRPALRTS